MSALDYFNDTHQMVRETVRKFVEREILPHVDDWEEAGEFPRELYHKAADAGILSINAPEEFGGTGEDVFMKIAACEELVRCSSGGAVRQPGVSGYWSAADLEVGQRCHEAEGGAGGDRWAEDLCPGHY